MAYAATVIITDRVDANGLRRCTINVSETEASSTSEWSTEASATNTVTVNGVSLATGQAWALPRSGRIVHYQATETAGTGTSIQPRLGKVTGWTASTQADIGQVTAAAMYINDATPLAFTLRPSDTGTLYGRSTPNNAAADHTIVTSIALVAEVP
jgi:hypothetical protein